MISRRFLISKALHGIDIIVLELSTTTLKDYENALKYFTLSIKEKMTQSAAYDNRMVHRKMGNTEACCQDLKLAIKYNEYGNELRFILINTAIN